MEGLTNGSAQSVQLKLALAVHLIWRSYGALNLICHPSNVPNSVSLVSSTIIKLYRPLIGEVKGNSQLPMFPSGKYNPV